MTRRPRDVLHYFDNSGIWIRLASSYCHEGGTSRSSVGMITIVLTPSLPIQRLESNRTAANVDCAPVSGFRR